MMQLADIHLSILDAEIITFDVHLYSNALSEKFGNLKCRRYLVIGVHICYILRNVAFCCFICLFSHAEEGKTK